jgi:hypothetical protein
MRKLFTLLFITVLTPALLQAQSGGGTCSNLFLSEYVEGYGNNKALEIYNPTASAINLANYKVARYVNGNTTPYGIALSGMVQPYDVVVVVLDKRDPFGTGLEEPIDEALELQGDLFINGVYDNPTSAMYFNGNDAVALLTSSNVIVDVLGRIGEDPGTAWSDQNGTWWTVNKTLARKSSIEMGDLNGYDVFMPEAQWDSLPVATYSGLGFHQSSCYIPPCSTPSNVSFSGLNTTYGVGDNAVTLEGSPAGGTFFGPGVSGNQFDPGTAGVGQHSIVYTYTNGNGCAGAYALCATVDLNVNIGGTEISPTEGLDVYPNPGSGLFNLKVNGFDGVISYTVYDAYGKEVKFGSFVAKGLMNQSIDLTELAIGAYTLQVQTSKGLFAEKLIKQ